MIIQLIVFLILVVVHDEVHLAADHDGARRAREEDREGLSAADTAKAELATANKRIEEQLSAARTDAAQRLADAERLAQRWSRRPRRERARKARRSSPPPAPRPSRKPIKAREVLREQVAALAVRGAEQILRREVDPRVHADLLSRLKVEL